MEVFPVEYSLVPLQGQLLVHTAERERERLNYSGKIESLYRYRDTVDIDRWIGTEGEREIELEEFDAYTLYSGNCLYLSNSASHSASERGGLTPLMRCHWVMLRPDSVRRVTPPIRTAPPTITLHPASHTPRTLLLPAEITPGSAACII